MQEYFLCLPSYPPHPGTGGRERERREGEGGVAGDGVGWGFGMGGRGAEDGTGGPESPDPFRFPSGERKTGRTRKVRTAELREVIGETREKQRRPGPNTVRFAWVKAHVGTQGNELVGQLTKEGVTLSKEWEGEGLERLVVERGVRQK